MPIVRIDMLVGTTELQKRDMVSSVTQAIVRSLGTPKEVVTVLITERTRDTWARAGRMFNDMDQSPNSERKEEGLP